MHTKDSSLRLPLMLIALVSLAGCGRSTYDQQLQTTLVELRSIKRSQVSAADLFGFINEYNPVAGGVINVRVPLVFERVYNIYSKDGANGLPVDPRKLYPAGVELQGYDRTFEAIAEDAEGSSWPYYYYIATRAVPDDQADQSAMQLLEKFRPVATKIPDQWEEIEIKTASKTVMHWKKLTFEGDFFFDRYTANGTTEWSKYPGVVDLYLYQSGGRQVLLACQQLKGFESVTLLDELMPLSASTLVIADDPAAEEPASPQDSGDAP